MDGKARHDPTTKLVVKECKPVPLDRAENPCSIEHRGDRYFNASAIMLSLIVFIIVCSLRKYYSNTSRVNILKHKIKRTDGKIKEAHRAMRAGEDMSKHQFVTMPATPVGKGSQALNFSQFEQLMDQNKS